ncbi:MAG: hypothetical protein R2864_00200 [Syntrophotaleaceae bacterium]
MAALIEPTETLQGIDLYIGDGSALDRARCAWNRAAPAAMRRSRSSCTGARAGIRRLIVSHRGAAIIADEAAALRKLTVTADRLNIALSIACDGQQLNLG